MAILKDYKLDKPRPYSLPPRVSLHWKITGKRIYTPIPIGFIIPGGVYPIPG
jgi:hypothetical protein